MHPAEEDVARGLHQSLSDHHSLPVVRELAGTEEFFEHRRLGLLHLQEEWVLAVAADQQRNPRARAYAAHSHHLAGEVGQLELLEQHPAVEVERLAIASNQPAERFEQLVAL